MIYDKLDFLGKYAPINQYAAEAEKYLKEHSAEELLALPIGRHEICGDKLVVIRQSFDAKPVDDHGFELHRKYTDLHVVLDGVETYFVEPVENPAAYEGYDAATDVLFYAQKPDGYIVLRPGLFVMFEPQDGHLSQRQYHGAPGHVEKLLFKLLNEAQ